MKALLIAAIMTISASALHAGPLGILGRDKTDDGKQVSANFQSFNYDKNAEWDRLKKISVKPSDTSNVSSAPAWNAVPQETRKQIDADLTMLGNFLGESFKDELKTRASNSWTLTDTPDDETAVLELAITRLIPSQQAKENTSISFDGRLVDKKTGKTIMSFSETKNYSVAQGAPWYGNCKEIIKGWGGTFAEMSMPSPEKSQDHSRLRKAARTFGTHFAIRKFMD